MSIRLVSDEQIRFDVDVESYNRLMRDLTAVVVKRCEDAINNMIVDGISEKMVKEISNSIDVNRLIEYMSANMDYGRVVEYTKTHLVGALLEDERFKTLLNRGINTATVGFTNETVERVSAQIKEELGIEGDV